MRVYKEITPDHGIAQKCFASDNSADYILTSARAHDLYNEFLRKHDRVPASRWYNANFRFERIK